MLELWLSIIFPLVLFSNSNFPENCSKIFKKKNDNEKLPVDSTDLFQ